MKKGLLDKYRDCGVAVEETRIGAVVSTEGFELVGTEVVSLEDKEEKTHHSRVHSLFVKSIDDDRKLYRLFLGNIMDFGTEINSILNALHDSGEHDKLEIRINSGGGRIDQGLGFINLMKNKFSGRTIAFIDQSAASMASSIFVNSDTRIIFPNSSIMFHNYSGLVVGKGSEIVSQVEHEEELYTKMLKDHIVVDKPILTEEEFSRLKDGKDFWFNCDQMCERGIATHVMVKNHCVPAKEYLERKLEGGLTPDQIVATHVDEVHDGQY